MKLVSLHWWLSAGGSGRFTGTEVFEVPQDEEVTDDLGMRILSYLSFGDTIGSYYTKFENATCAGSAVVNFGVTRIREIKTTKRKTFKLRIFKEKIE